jgi:glycosyltransferase involved in cell wall biosynthesis
MYNAELYIESTIQSVLQQESHPVQYEIIVVDDASLDKSVEIVSKMTYANIQLHVLAINGGTANARNVGIKNATGDWIIFLDSDDRLSSNLFANFVHSYNSGFNCYLFGFIREHVNYQQIQNIKIAKDKRAYGLFGTVCNKITHKSLLVDFKLGYSFEDVCFIVDMMNSKDLNVRIINDSYYLYNKLNPTSKMANFNSNEYKKMFKYVLSQIRNSDTLTKMFILEVFVGILFSKNIPLTLSIPITIKILSRLFFYLPLVIWSQCRFWVDTKIKMTSSL